MCTVLLLLRPDKAWPLLLGANRDERHDRAFEPPGRYWAEAPQVVAGRDLLGGGSWFGVNDGGVAATIVNGLYRLGPLEGKASRGELVLRALGHPNAQSAAAALGSLDPERYRGFTLIVADCDAAFAVNSDERRVEVRELAPGHHLVTPEGVDVPSSPRYAAHFGTFRDAVPPDPETGTWTSWTEILREDDAADPHRAVTISAGEFGTVCSTLLGLPRDSSRPPALVFAAGPPTRAAYVAITEPWVRGAAVEGAR